MTKTILLYINGWKMSQGHENNTSIVKLLNEKYF